MNETNEAGGVPEPMKPDEIAVHMARTMPHVYHPTDYEYTVLCNVVNDIMVGRADDLPNGLTLNLIRTKAGRTFVRQGMYRTLIKPMAEQHAILVLVDEALRYREYDALFRECVERVVKATKYHA